MKRTLLVFITVLILAFSTKALAQQKSRTTGNGYQAQINYPGDYQSNVLYVRNNGATIIQAIPHLDHLKDVTCYDALAYLKREGRWQGHLMPDGSCGSYDEPAEYTMGNRLNYNELQSPINN